MIPSATRESKRFKSIKMNRVHEKLYKAAKCRECTVVVTRMNFAKILGKFNRVKIQYENSETPRSKKKSQATTQINSRLKSNENGMVLIHRNAYNEHPVKEPTRKSTPRVSAMKENRKSKEMAQRQASSVLKENNRVKKTPTSSKPKPAPVATVTYYGIVFTKPNATRRNTNRNKFQLAQLLPIDKSLLPSAEWDIDYLPKIGEPKDDKVYERIAAELEDLMSSEKPEGTKDDFPSIIDILNEGTPKTTTDNQSSSSGHKSNLDSSDVEAMLLGETGSRPQPMEVDSAALAPPADSSLDNPNSPSILDETLEKGSEARIPAAPSETEPSKPKEATPTKDGDDNKNKDNNAMGENNNSLNIGTVTHVVFKKLSNGTCEKSVTCPKNLQYSIELEGKAVEFLGAPKFIGSPDDLRVLLEIVHESKLDSLHVSH